MQERIRYASTHQVRITHASRIKHTSRIYMNQPENMENQAFVTLGISNEILQSIQEMGFEEPTSIQQECIPKILSGTDLVGQAQTGTGKTAAFGIPAIMKVEKGGKIPNVLILCPTRELAIQVTGELIKLARHTQGVFVVPVYGG
ncbi:MAG: DEAD/DEAH box helicase, partial [Balneolaceae bacterium]